MRTTVPAAEDALVALLQARPALSDAVTLVQLGLPAEVPAETDRLYVTDMDNLTRGAVTDQQLRRESYRLGVLIEVHRLGADSREDVRQRMWGMHDELEQLLLGDDELGGAVWASHLATIDSAVILPSADGYLGKLVARVELVAIV